MVVKKSGGRLRLAGRRGEIVTAIYQLFGASTWTYGDLMALGVPVPGPTTVGALVSDGFVDCIDTAKPRKYRLAERTIRGIEAGKVIL